MSCVAIACAATIFSVSQSLHLLLSLSLSLNVSYGFCSDIISLWICYLLWFPDLLNKDWSSPSPCTAKWKWYSFFFLWITSTIVLDHQQYFVEFLSSHPFFFHCINCLFWILGNMKKWNLILILFAIKLSLVDEIGNTWIFCFVLLFFISWIMIRCRQLLVSPLSLVLFLFIFSIFYSTQKYFFWVSNKC